MSMVIELHVEVTPVPSPIGAVFYVLYRLVDLASAMAHSICLNLRSVY